MARDAPMLLVSGQYCSLCEISVLVKFATNLPITAHVHYENYVMSCANCGVA